MTNTKVSSKCWPKTTRATQSFLQSPSIWCWLRCAKSFGNSESASAILGMRVSGVVYMVRRQYLEEGDKSVLTSKTYRGVRRRHGTVRQMRNRYIPVLACSCRGDSRARSLVTSVCPPTRSAWVVPPPGSRHAATLNKVHACTGGGPRTPSRQGHTSSVVGQ